MVLRPAYPKLEASYKAEQFTPELMWQTGGRDCRTKDEAARIAPLKNTATKTDNTTNSKKRRRHQAANRAPF